MSTAASMDYLAIGHPTLDRTATGDVTLGGTVLYSGLQAARLGLRCMMIGNASAQSMRPLWEPYEREAALVIDDRPATTTFRNVQHAGVRRQTIEAWAGPMRFPDGLPASEILHIAPVAHELDLIDDAILAAAASFRGITAQGLLRRWDAHGSVTLSAYDASPEVTKALDAVVVADYEAAFAASLIDGVAKAGGLAVITRAEHGSRVISRTGEQDYPAEFVRSIVDSTGAGDIFASALFVALYRGAQVPDAIRAASLAAARSLEVTGLRALDASVIDVGPVGSVVRRWSST